MENSNPRERPNTTTCTSTAMERVCEKLDNLGQRMSAIEAQLQMNVSSGNYN